MAVPKTYMIVLLLQTFVWMKISANQQMRYPQQHNTQGSKIKKPVSVQSYSYPISASWFRDRFTQKDWEETLNAFQFIGGNTVWLRAPPVILRSKQDILSDPNFAYCKSYKSPDGLGDPDCVTEAEQELTQMGVKIKGFATYQYEEGFSDKIMVCSDYDRKINSSRIYYRLVLPLQELSSNPCNMQNGSEVIVLFTSFGGIDPHYLLAQTATTHNMSVYFGLPSIGKLSEDSFPAYFQLVYRILDEHMARYGEIKALTLKDGSKIKVKLFDTIKGYYGTDEVCLAAMPTPSVQSLYTKLYSTLGKLVHHFGKKFGITPYIILNKSQGNYTMEEHVTGFETLAKTGDIDIIAVQEGRGSGRGVYYWGTEVDKKIKDVDPGLHKIVRYLDPSVKDDITFREQYSGSNNMLFGMFRQSKDNLVNAGIKFEYWLSIEAFEYLRDDPCLPVDPAGSGMDELIDRTTKLRIDKALNVAGIQPDKVIAFAWDSDFTCKARGNNLSLAEEIHQDWNRPIIMNCSWHSPQNMSIVIIGYNIMGLTQRLQVEYPRVQGDRPTASLYGTYFETAWGSAHGRLDSLEYIQMVDVVQPYFIAPHGNVTVKAEPAHHECVFVY